MNKFAIAAVAALLSTTAAFAEEAPRIAGDFASQHVVYGQAARGNIVGGGVAVVTGVDEGRPVISYLDNGLAQQGLAGQVPAVENVAGRDRTIWVPASGLRG